MFLVLSNCTRPLTPSPPPSPISPDSRLTRMFSRHGGQAHPGAPDPSCCLLGTESQSQPERVLPSHFTCPVVNRIPARAQNPPSTPFSPDQPFQSIFSPPKPLCFSPLPPTCPEHPAAAGRSFSNMTQHPPTPLSLGCESSSLPLATQLDLRPPLPSPSALLSPLPQPHWPPWFLSWPSPPPPQGLCTCCPLYLKRSPPRHLWGLLPSFHQTPAQMSPAPRRLPWPRFINSNSPPNPLSFPLFSFGFYVELTTSVELISCLLSPLLSGILREMGLVCPVPGHAPSTWK